MATDDLRYPEGMIADEYGELPESTLPPGVGSMPGKTRWEAEEEATTTDGLISGRGLVSEIHNDIGLHFVAWSLRDKTFFL